MREAHAEGVHRAAAREQQAGVGRHPRQQREPEQARPRGPRHVDPQAAQAQRFETLEPAAVHPGRRPGGAGLAPAGRYSSAKAAKLSARAYSL